MDKNLNDSMVHFLQASVPGIATASLEDSLIDLLDFSDLSLLPGTQ
jgi:hypothetical protein